MFRFWILVAALLLWTSCQAQQRVSDASYELMLNNLLEHNVTEKSVSEALKQETSKTIYLDAREKQEFDVSHIKNAVWVGYDTQDLSLLDTLDKSTPLVVYCSIGYRSEKTVQKLMTKGFSNVSNLYGGVFEWVNQGNPVYVKSQVTSNVHAYSKSWGVWLRKGNKVYD